MKKFFTLMIALSSFAILAETYHVRVDGNDANSGLSEKDAWKSVDRGQPTFLLKSCKPGDTVLHVLKANQLPKSGKVRIGDVEITYTGRTLQSLTGCSNVPEAREGSKVWSVTYTPAGAGDEIVVHRGIYNLDYPSKVESGNRSFAVAMFFSGGRRGKPLRVTGEGLPVVDAEEEDGVASISIQDDDIEISGFDIRRGGILARNARRVKVLNSRVHEGKNAINAYSIRDGEIAGNMVYDMVGAWTSHGIVLSHCSKIDVHNNTIVSNAYAMRFASCRKIKVRNNLIAWCRSGIINDGTSSANIAMSNNNIWWVGHGIWLQRDDQNDIKHKRYINCKPGETDISADPLIVEWNPAKKNFLCPLKSSPCVKDGKVWIGAGKVADAFPVVRRGSREPLVFNGSFEAGLLGWFIDSWIPFQPGEAGWKIVGKKGCEGGKCLELFDFPKPGKRIAVKAQSLSFRYTRGKALRITFMAKAEKAGNVLNVGILVPSWQNKSGLSKRVELTTEWHTYSIIVKPLTRFPDYARIVFTTIAGTRCWIDAVSAREVDAKTAKTADSGDSNAAALLPKFEFAPDWTPGMIVPNARLTGTLINRTGQDATGALKWTLEAPLRGKASSGTAPFTALKEKARFTLNLDKKLSGIFLLRYSFVVDGDKVAGGKFRISLSDSKPEKAKRFFFSATPPFSSMIIGETLEKQMSSLAGLGLSTLHLYMGYKRLNELMYSSKFSEIEKISARERLNWMFTPSDAAALTGKATWAPAPGNVGPNAIEVKRDDLKGERCSEQQLKAWDTALRMLVAKYAGKIKFYEVLNEPNCFLNGEEYKKVLIHSSRVIRDADPKAAIIAGSVVTAVGKDLWNAAMTVPPGTFDAFSYHPYRFGLRNPERENESFRRDFIRCENDLVKHGHKPVVWLTEEGMGPGLNETRSIGIGLSFSGYPRLAEFHKGEILQALYGARMFLTAFGEGGMGYSYHTLSNMVTDSLMSPMLVLKVVHTIRTVIGDAEPLGRVDVARGFVCYLFKKRDGAIVAAVWMKDAEYGTPVNIRARSKELKKAFDAFGFSLPLKFDENGAELTMDRSVAYLLFSAGTQEANARASLADALKNISVQPGPLKKGE